MFDKEFYPTPESVLDQMGIDCNGKVVLEPSAGKGNIVDYCKRWGASEVLAVEKVADLRKILSSKCTVIGEDFFKVQSPDISHVNMIVMNPPFSNAESHILHAWKIAPEGCEIIALCNWETVDNVRGYGRSELSELISHYGEKLNLSRAFTSAERPTYVEVGLIRLFKPMLSDESRFEGFYVGLEEDQVQDNGVVPYNEIRAIVQTYYSAVKTFEKVEEVSKELAEFTNATFLGKQLPNGSFEKHKLSYGEGIVFKASYDDYIVTKETFARTFQKKCWDFIFKRVGIDKYVTQGVMDDINAFVQNRKNYPFTVRNILKMFEIIHGTRRQIMDRAIVSAVDNITRYTHENRYGVEGWKTNAGHLLNRKFICEGVSQISWGGTLQFRIGANSITRIEDLSKAICYLTGVDYDSIEKLYNLRDLRPNTWYDWGFFEVKTFKKGSGHFKFKDEKVWETLNRAYAEAKGQTLPEKL